MISAYTLIRSARRTIAICIQEDGSVIVRAPYRLPRTAIETFVEKKQKWIEAQQKKCEERQSGRIEISREERVCGMEKAREVIARVFCGCNGRGLWKDYDQGAKDAVGELQQRRQSEF